VETLVGPRQGTTCRLGRDLVAAGHAGDAVAGEQDQVERRRGEPDQGLDAAAALQLRTGAVGHGGAIVDSRPVLIREVMTESVVTAEPQQSVRSVAELMRERNVGSVVLVTDRDLTLSVLADGRDPSGPAADHASSPVITAAPDMELEEGAELMMRHGVRRLVVVDAGLLVGVVTLDDLASRTSPSEVSGDLSARVTRAAMPDYFFRQRGG
jgi:CBS domain-containing protein